jgi:hypothetical protein
MATRFRPFRPRYAKRAPDPTPALVAPPLPGAVVDAVLRYSDVQEDVGGGNTLIRLSPKRLRDAEVRRSLGKAAARAAAVSILWNERESQIVRVFEDRTPAALAA